MDWQFKIGLGLAVIFGFLPFAVRDMPHWITWPGITVGGLFIVWGLLPDHEKYPLLPSFIFIACAAGMSASAVWALDSASNVQRLSFQKFALFWVAVDNDLYEIGVVTKFFNPTDKSYLINGLSFDGEGWSLFPRGSYLIRGLAENEDHAELLEDNYIKPNNEAYFKKLLPIKFDMTVNGGSMPEFILRGKWNLLFGNEKSAVLPNFYSVYPQPLTSTQWDELRKPQSRINVDGLRYKTIPPKRPTSGEDQLYLVYNPDRSATIDNPYFAQTPPVKGKDGVMIFIGGKDPPPPDWVVLGHTYEEVWSDKDKLKIYNSLFPPDAKGLPRPFGFFAGMENRMAGHLDRELSAPTTRAADIIDFAWPKAPKKKRFLNLF